MACEGTGTARQFLRNAGTFQACPASWISSNRKAAELHCSRCHAIGNTDKSLMEGAPPFRDLKLRYPIEDLAEALAEGIMTSHPQMPVFTFTPEQIDDLLAYLGSLE